MSLAVRMLQLCTSHSVITWRAAFILQVLVAQCSLDLMYRPGLVWPTTAAYMLPVRVLSTSSYDT